LKLLDAGIDVLHQFETSSTRRVAWIPVRQITGSTVQETVPDSVLDGAEIELIRPAAGRTAQTHLDEGKVYCRNRAERGDDEFFSARAI